MLSGKSLTVVLPAYNEEARIGPALDELFGYLRRRGDHAREGAPGSGGLPRAIEILVVDDGSTDETAALVAQRPEAEAVTGIPGVTLRVMTVPHGGKGAAVRAGMLAAAIGPRGLRRRGYGHATRSASAARQGAWRS